MARGRVIYLCLSLIVCAFTAFAAGRVPLYRTDILEEVRGKPMRFIIASDTHYLSPRLTDYGERFMEIIADADGKLTHYSPQVFKAFVWAVINEKPDALILCGDLTLNGSLESHEEVSALLGEVRDAGIPVYVIPGNHDVDVMAYSFDAEGAKPFEGASSEEFRRLYSSLGFDGAISEDKETMSYSARLADDLWLLAIDVNGWYGIGALPPATVKWAEAQLIQAQAEGAEVIAISHQNLLLHNERFSFGFQMIKDEPLIELYERYGVRLNVSGHIHVQHIIEEDGITDIAQSSLMVSPNQYGVLEVSRGRGFKYRTEPLDVAAWARAVGDDNPDLLDFAEYSKAFFVDSALRKRLGRAPDMAAAQAAAEANRRYFAGYPGEGAADMNVWESGE